jgi:hypothetical protein
MFAAIRYFLSWAANNVSHVIFWAVLSFLHVRDKDRMCISVNPSCWVDGILTLMTIIADAGVRAWQMAAKGIWYKWAITRTIVSKLDSFTDHQNFFILFDLFSYESHFLSTQRKIFFKSTRAKNILFTRVNHPVNLGLRTCNYFLIVYKSKLFCLHHALD